MSTRHRGVRVPWRAVHDGADNYHNRRQEAPGARPAGGRFVRKGPLSSASCDRRFRGGGALRLWMITHCQSGEQCGSSERQNIGAVQSFEGKKGGQSTSSLAPNKGSRPNL